MPYELKSNPSYPGRYDIWYNGNRIVIGVSEVYAMRRLADLQAREEREEINFTQRYKK